MSVSNVLAMKNLVVENCSDAQYRQMTTVDDVSGHGNLYVICFNRILVQVLEAFHFLPLLYHG